MDNCENRKKEVGSERIFIALEEYNEIFAYLNRYYKESFFAKAEE